MRLTLVCLLSALALSASADLAHNAEGDVPHADGLSGADIYDLVVEHRLRSFLAKATLRNGNGQGDDRRLRFLLLWKDFSEEDEELLSKTRIEVLWPFDERFLGMLIERRRDEPSQQWAYVPKLRTKRRFPLRAESVHGSAFTFDDIIPPEAEHFRYRRLADSTYEGEPVYVVELAPERHAPGEHSRILVSIDQARAVVLRARYWNAAGAEVKELAIPPASLEEHDGSWFPMVLSIRDLRTGAASTIRVTEFTANLELTEHEFGQMQLEGH